MRCVFDTNVLVSALLASKSQPRKALDFALRAGEVLLSISTLAELSSVLSRERFKTYIDEEDVRDFLAALVRETQWIQVDVHISACRDPKDDKFLELAISGRATHIVTGDADLLVLDPFKGIRIASPKDFLREPFTEERSGPTE